MVLLFQHEMLLLWIKVQLLQKVFVGMLVVVYKCISFLLYNKLFKCRSRNALLNGDTSNYDWDSGYTCHQVGSGSILVQLGQPYIIDSMRYILLYYL